MKNIIDLNKKLRELAEQTKGHERALRKGIEKNARIACEAMEQAAKKHTPHEGDGKARGFNVISNSLQDSWVAEYTPSANKNEVGTVSLSNDKPYAKYVQEGHRVKKHFVPWLYKDGMGTLSYETNHSQPLFGLVVGTKTPFVKGVDMVGPAVEAFNEKFDELTKKLMARLFGE
jgi:hypothetical protein